MRTLSIEGRYPSEDDSIPLAVVKVGRFLKHRDQNLFPDDILRVQGNLPSVLLIHRSRIKTTFTMDGQAQETLSPNRLESSVMESDAPIHGWSQNLYHENGQLKATPVSPNESKSDCGDLSQEGDDWVIFDEEEDILQLWPLKTDVISKNRCIDYSPDWKMHRPPPHPHTHQIYSHQTHKYPTHQHQTHEQPVVEEPITETVDATKNFEFSGTNNTNPPSNAWSVTLAIQPRSTFNLKSSLSDSVMFSSPPSSTYSTHHVTTEEIIWIRERLTSNPPRQIPLPHPLMTAPLLDMPQLLSASKDDKWQAIRSHDILSDVSWTDLNIDLTYGHTGLSQIIARIFSHLMVNRWAEFCDIVTVNHDVFHFLLLHVGHEEYSLQLFQLWASQKKTSNVQQILFDLLSDEIRRCQEILEFSFDYGRVEDYIRRLLELRQICLEMSSHSEDLNLIRADDVNETVVEDWILLPFCLSEACLQQASLVLQHGPPLRAALAEKCVEEMTELLEKVTKSPVTYVTRRKVEDVTARCQVYRAMTSLLRQNQTKCVVKMLREDTFRDIMTIMMGHNGDIVSSAIVQMFDVLFREYSESITQYATTDFCDAIRNLVTEFRERVEDKQRGDTVHLLMMIGLIWDSNISHLIDVDEMTCACLAELRYKQPSEPESSSDSPSIKDSILLRPGLHDHIEVDDEMIMIETEDAPEGGGEEMGTGEGDMNSGWYHKASLIGSSLKNSIPNFFG
ncbi:hypothetical protein PROFUN_03115 [Planoprotostelium fungivorum]|uniref:Uncharacterized protein n=1 Tax=Planoprotostelium fungivorum TaxID=1890364 RepID=A0A2P6NQE4_9EUKA|nr:hypothetical protein PROFUN_03115 [Planoprotostelium fungivorum]